ncbi:MAG TPA: hypothetical protein VIH57_04285 [Bacteroidales bacterium]
MKTLILTGLILLLTFNNYSQKNTKLSSLENVGTYLLFDKNVPDTNPKVYANSFFSRDSSYIGYCSLSL